MSKIDFEAGNLASLSVGGVEYPAEDGVISVPVEFADELKAQGLVIAQSQPADDGKDTGDVVMIDGVEADRDALVAFLTAAEQPPHPLTGEKKLREKVRAIQAALSA